MPSRQQNSCVAEVKDGKRYPISLDYESVEEAEDRKSELSAKVEHHGKNLQVVKAT
jgi:hypothetical protein